MAFPIRYELTVLACTCHGLCAVNNEIFDLYRVKFDISIIKQCHAKFVECLPKECIASDKEKEVKSFLECRIVKFLLKHGEVVLVE